MTHRPRITEESVLTRWMGMEIARINDGMVSGRKTLSSLLAEEDPMALTKAGGEYYFRNGNTRRPSSSPVTCAGRTASIPKTCGKRRS